VQVVIASAFLLTVDQVANAGGLEALLIDTAGRVVSGSYSRRVALHESGHFLIAYLLGLLPRDYTLSSLDLFLRYPPAVPRAWQALPHLAAPHRTVLAGVALAASSNRCCPSSCASS
jgi:hypothetical protein